jgi:hypothetical protein
LSIVSVVSTSTTIVVKFRVVLFELQKFRVHILFCWRNKKNYLVLKTQINLILSYLICFLQNVDEFVHLSSVRWCKECVWCAFVVWSSSTSNSKDKKLKLVIHRVFNFKCFEHTCEHNPQYLMESHNWWQILRHQHL